MQFFRYKQHDEVTVTEDSRIVCECRFAVAVKNNKILVYAAPNSIMPTNCLPEFGDVIREYANKIDDDVIDIYIQAVGFIDTGYFHYHLVFDKREDDNSFILTLEPIPQSKIPEGLIYTFSEMKEELNRWILAESIAG